MSLIKTEGLYRLLPAFDVIACRAMCHTKGIGDLIKDIPEAAMRMTCCSMSVRFERSMFMGSGG